MNFSDLNAPKRSENIATFGGGGAPSPVAKLNYNVPLPGSHSFNRVVPVEFPPEWFAPGSERRGASLRELGVVQGDGDALAGLDQGLLTRIYRRALPATHRPSHRAVARVNGDVLPLLTDATRRAGDGGDAPRLRARAADAEEFGVLDRRMLVAEPDDVEIQRRRTDSYIDKLAAEQVGAAPFFKHMPAVRMPVTGIGSSVQEIEINPVAPPEPQLALVETWDLRHVLGDYGLGRTLSTFSLLPGERTTITVETWRTDAATREDSSSIFESSDTAAQTRFTSTLMNETGAARQEQGGWALSVNTGASGGGKFLEIVDGKAYFDVGFAANHQEAAQQWSKNISQSASEHANQVNNSRRQAVNQTSSTMTSGGTATTTVREVANTNLRRVLNFVYRELNQTYKTYVVLRDIKVAFYNGKVGSAEIVPLGEIGRLIRRHIVAERQQEVARRVLSLCAERLDSTSQPVPVLEVGSRRDGIRYVWLPARLGKDGKVAFEGDPLGDDVRWRFKPGPLGDAELPHKMDGLVTGASEVVLRTDSVVVEALLGEADALDPYASALQGLDLDARQADIAWRKADTRRIEDALKLVQDAGDNGGKVAVWTKIFPDNPDIQVVPVAAVENGDGG